MATNDTGRYLLALEVLDGHYSVKGTISPPANRAAPQAVLPHPDTIAVSIPGQTEVSAISDVTSTGRVGH